MNPFAEQKQKEAHCPFLPAGVLQILSCFGHLVRRNCLHRRPPEFCSFEERIKFITPAANAMFASDCRQLFLFAVQLLDESNSGLALPKHRVKILLRSNASFQYLQVISRHLQWKPTFRPAF